MKTAKRAIIALLIVAICLPVFAQGGKEASAPAATKTTSTVTAAAPEKVVFKVSNSAEPESLDPAKIQGVPEHRLFEGLFEGLIVYDPKTADGIPGVAESWTVSDDGLVYTFKLRKNAK